MDTCIWGPHLWSLLDSLVRVLNPRYLLRDLTDDDRREYRRDLILLLYSLRYMLPCMHCRDSYRVYVKTLPPEAEADLTIWLWKVHEEVNKKLDRVSGCSLAKFEKRITVWTSFVDPFQVWDMLTVMALNYPKYERRDEDKESEPKKYAYYIFFHCLSRLLARIPTLADLETYVSPGAWVAESLEDRVLFFRMVSSAKFRWAYERGKSLTELEAMKFSEAKTIESLL